MKKLLFITLLSLAAGLSSSPQHTQAQTPRKLTSKADSTRAHFERLLAAHSKLIRQTNTLAHTAKMQAKKLIQLRQLMKKLRGQIGTVYARRKPCPWGKKGKGCRLARRIERMEQRLNNHKLKGGNNPTKIR